MSSAASIKWSSLQAVTLLVMHCASTGVSLLANDS